MHTLACEQDMLEWINDHSDSTFKDLKDFKPVKNSTYEPEPVLLNFSLITLLDVMKKHIFLFSMTTVLMKINEV